MSASTERKNRLAEMEAGTYRKQTAQRERDEKKAKDRRTLTLCICVVVVIVLAAILLNVIPDMKEKQELRRYQEGVAVTIGERSYSPAEIGYLYANQFSSVANSYIAYFYGLDTSKGAVGLSAQPYTGPVEEGKNIATWRDYLLDSVYTQLEQTQTILKYAKEQGIELDEVEKQDIENDIATYKLYAAQYGYSSVDQFLNVNLSKGLTLDTIRTLETESVLAQKAYDAYVESLSFSDEQLKEESAAYHDDYDLFSYALYTAHAEAAEGEDAPSDAAKAEAGSKVDAVIASYKDGGDVEDLYERFSGYIEEELLETADKREGTAGSSLSSLYADWMKDESRQAGDIEKFSDEDGDHYYAVLFLGREDGNYKTVNVRHILIKAEADADGNYSDEAKEKARTSAEDILKVFLAGDQSEESFASLAEQYSEDGGSNTNGGLYENVTKGQMVQEFNDFLFAEGHQAGDTGIVHGNNGSYDGYHVMFYVGEGRAYFDIVAENALKEKALTEWLESGEFTAVPGADEALVDPVVAAPAGEETKAEG